MIKVLFICYGNICRSPMSEFILKDMVERHSLTDRFEIASAATSTEEIWGGRGNPIYPPARQSLKRHGIGDTPYTDFSGKRARQVMRSDYTYYDYLLCADVNNVRNTIRITGPDVDNKIKLLLDFPRMRADTGSPLQIPGIRTGSRTPMRTLCSAVPDS